MNSGAWEALVARVQFVATFCFLNDAFLPFLHTADLCAQDIEKVDVCVCDMNCSPHEAVGVVLSGIAGMHMMHAWQGRFTTCKSAHSLLAVGKFHGQCTH